MKGIIRLVLFMLLGVGLANSQVAHAQDLVLDSLRITLEVREVPLREVLQQIVSQTKVQLVYPDALVADIATSCSFKNASLRQALEEILTPVELAYRVMLDGQMVIVWRGWAEVSPEPPGPPELPGLGPPPFGMGTPPPRWPQFIESVLRDLDLSETQRTRIDTIRLAQREQALELFRKRQNRELDIDSLRSARHKLNAEMMQQMKSVLTETQLEEFKKRVEQNRARPREFSPGGPKRGGIPPGPRMRE